MFDEIVCKVMDKITPHIPTVDDQVKLAVISGLLSKKYDDDVNLEDLIDEAKIIHHRIMQDWE